MPRAPYLDPDFAASVKKSLDEWMLSHGGSTKEVNLKNLLKQLEPFAGKEVRLFCVPPGTTVRGILKKAEDGYVQLEEKTEIVHEPENALPHEAAYVTKNISVITVRRCVPFESIKMIEGELHRKEVTSWPSKSKTAGEV